MYVVNYKKHLDRSRRLGDDEFYTRVEDVSRQVGVYKDYFEGSTVYCNCDSSHSAFYEYFLTNFRDLGLDGLVATGINPDFDFCGERTVYDGNSLTFSAFRDDRGMFDYPKNLELLKRDNLILCTNPPFSLLRDFLPMVFDSGVKFLLLVPVFIYGYKDIAPYLIKDNVFWAAEGTEKKFVFGRPGGGEMLNKNCHFITNIGERPRYDFPLVDNPIGDYERFDFRPDVIEVGSYLNIPDNYYGKIAVPITYMFRHDPRRFEIVDVYRNYLFVNGKEKFKRIVIRRVMPSPLGVWV